MSSKLKMAQKTSRGRPASDVDMNALLYLKTIGLPMTVIAELMGVSRQTLYNRIAQSGNAASYATFTAISHSDLDSLLAQTIQRHPNNGEVMLAGYLCSEGIRVPRSPEKC